MNIQHELRRKRLSLLRQLTLLERIIETIPNKQKPAAKGGLGSLRSRSIFAVREVPKPAASAPPPTSPEAMRPFLEQLSRDLAQRIAAIDRFLGENETGPR